MDKAQARILFLVLIGILFFGQAVYDYIKKQKKSSARKPTAHYKKGNVQNGYKRMSTSAPSPMSKKRESNFNQTTPVHQVNEPLPHKAKSLVEEETETAMIAETESTGCNQKTDMDIRNAVIWSEILKRKF